MSNHAGCMIDPKNAERRADDEMVDISKTLLTWIRADPKNFYRSLATQDKTRVHLIDSETKIQSKQQKQSSSPPRSITSRQRLLANWWLLYFGESKNVLL